MRGPVRVRARDEPGEAPGPRGGGGQEQPDQGRDEPQEPAADAADARGAHPAQVQDEAPQDERVPGRGGVQGDAVRGEAEAEQAAGGAGRRHRGARVADADLRREAAGRGRRRLAAGPDRQHAQAAHEAEAALEE